MWIRDLFLKKRSLIFRAQSRTRSQQETKASPQAEVVLKCSQNTTTQKIFKKLQVCYGQFICYYEEIIIFS